jgi:IclR family KDG regulon transcriptional repressor
MAVDVATSLRRGILLLNALASDDVIAAGGLGVAQLARMIDGDKSQISRTLKALHNHGLVERDPDTRAYRLGAALFALAERASRAQIISLGEQTLKSLVETVGERVHLSMLQGRDVLTVMSESPPHSIQAAGWVGRTNPAYCSATGQALLLDADLDELRRLFAGVEFVQFGPKTARTVEEFHARVKAARARRYTVAKDEFEEGHVAVAAPVRDFRGRIQAALNVSGPKFRLAARVPELGAAVVAAADAIGSELGAGR